MWLTRARPQPTTHQTHDPPTAHPPNRAKRTLLTRHESDLKDNNYWIGLITHLQRDEARAHTAVAPPLHLRSRPPPLSPPFLPFSHPNQRQPTNPNAIKPH